MKSTCCEGSRESLPGELGQTLIFDMNCGEVTPGEVREQASQWCEQAILCGVGESDRTRRIHTMRYTHMGIHICTVIWAGEAMSRGKREVSTLPPADTREL